MANERTIQDQRRVITRILRAWELVPHLRLGQLLANVAVHTNDPSLFGTDDAELATQIEQYVLRVKDLGKAGGQPPTRQQLQTASRCIICDVVLLPGRFAVRQVVSVQKGNNLSAQAMTWCDDCWKDFFPET